jgi:hypothetical protein
MPTINLVSKLADLLKQKNVEPYEDVIIDILRSPGYSDDEAVAALMKDEEKILKFISPFQGNNSKN